MKDCRDCIHYDVCAFHITEETDMSVEECAHGFKDKARYIELPLKIGDVVYQSIDKKYVYGIEVSRVIYTKDGLEFGGYTRNNTFRRFYVSDIGETIFLNRQETVKALAERRR